MCTRRVRVALTTICRQTLHANTTAVIVHIWDKTSDNYGHAALTVRGDYISFWPEAAAGKKDAKTKRHVSSAFNSLAEDCFLEGCQPKEVVLTGLDEAAMIKYIADVRASKPLYQITRNNCAHIVAQALIRGAGRQPSFKPHAGGYAPFGLGQLFGHNVWTPGQVYKFAEELKARSE